MEVLVKRKVAGIEMTVFQPTPKMRLFALTAIADPAFIGKDPEIICSAIGIGKSAYAGFQKFNPWFEEWFEEIRVALGGKNKRAMLEFVGMERALAGDFQFWKPFAIKEGVISPDQLNVGAAIPSSLGAFKEMNHEQLQSLQNTLLASLRGDTNQGEIALVEGPAGWRQEGDSGGAPALPEGSLAVAAELGADGERALQELESF